MTLDKRDLESMLNDHLRNMNWNQGVSKDELMQRVQNDEALRSMIGQYLADGTYKSLDEVKQLIPAQAWQAAQGDEWRGGEIHDIQGMPSNFEDGPVGQDRHDVYQPGSGQNVPTPGFGETGRTEGNAQGQE